MKVARIIKKIFIINRKGGIGKTLVADEVVNGTDRFKATKEFMEFFKEKHKDEPIYCLPQSGVFVQSRFANQSVVAYNSRFPAALVISVLTHGVWKILKLKFQ